MSNQYTWILSKDKMYINGVSSDTVGIYVDTPPMPPMPEERTEQNFVHGRAESSVYHTGQYNDIEIAVTCYVFDYGSHPDNIYKYISGAKTLSFSSSDHFFYKVKRVLGITPAYNGKGMNTLIVRFSCSPFKYAVTNPEIVYTIPEGETSATIQVFNAGSIYSEPVIWLSEGENHGAAEITVNGIEVSVPQTTSSDVYFDLPRMEAYYIQNGEMKVPGGGMISGRWWDFILPPGYSEITWTVSRTLKITKNERYL